MRKFIEELIVNSFVVVMVLSGLSCFCFIVALFILFCAALGISIFIHLGVSLLIDRKLRGDLIDVWFPRITLFGSGWW